MSKDKLTDYSSTADSNTDIGGISIAEGMSPSAVNNAIREQMSHQKEAFGSGTPLYVDQTNNRVGIGSSAPSRKLELNNGGTGALVTFTDGVATNFTFKTDGSSVGTFGTEAGSTQLAFMSSGTERMRLTSGGILLYGKTATNSDNAGFEVGTNGAIAATRASGHAALLNRLTDDGRILNLRKDGTTVGGLGVNGSLLHIALREDGSNPVALAGSGSDTGAVVPATTSGAERDNAINLGKSTNRFKHGYFANTVFADAFTGQSDTDTAIQMTGSDIMKFFTGGSERARITSSGISVGKTNSGNVGTVGSELNTSGYGMFSRSTGNVLFLNRNDTGTSILFYKNSVNVGSISVSSGATAFNTSSDRRLKSNIQDSPSASAKIDAIQVRQFDWNETGNHQDYGLIAQELQPIEPMAVTGDADSDEMMSVDYSKLVPMLIKEIQELRGRVAALEAS